MDRIIFAWLPLLAYIKMQNHLQLDMRDHGVQCVGVLKAVSFRKGFCDLIFPLINLFF